MTPSPEQLTLRIFVPLEQQTLREFYRIQIERHNSNMYDMYADSGFDLGLPDNYILTKPFGNKLSLNVHASMWKNDTPQAYYLYPRSSISNTPMRLSNSVGIIDKGYRGPLTAMVDIIDANMQNYSVSAFQRYFQVCHPSLNFFKVIMVNSKEELGTTERNEGGFGSTGL